MIAMSEEATQAVPTAAPRRGRVTAFANLKGGVGKTTNAVNLACGLGQGLTLPETGQKLPPQKVLLIDFESLSTASAWLGVQAEGHWDSCATLFEEPKGDDWGTAEEQAAAMAEHREMILKLPRPAKHECIDVIPADERGVLTTDHSKISDFQLRENLEILREVYDHIIIDLPGQRQELMLRSTLIAADGVVIPIKPDSTVLKSMRTLLVMIRDMQKGANRDLQFDGILISQAGFKGDKDATETQAILSQVPNLYTFNTMIRTLKPISRSSAVHRSVFGMENSEEAARDYSRLTFEWLQRATA